MRRVTGFTLVVLCFSTALVVLGNWATPTLLAQAIEKTQQQEVLEVFQKYTKLEKNQDYAHVYDLLTSRYKAQLKKDNRINSPQDYERLRRSSEAQWTAFRVVKVDTWGAGGFRLLVDATADESGVIETDRKHYYIAREPDGWKIDHWALVTAGRPHAER